MRRIVGWALSGGSGHGPASAGARSPQESTSISIKRHKKLSSYIPSVRLMEGVLLII